MNEIGHSAIYDLVSEIIYGDSDIDFARSYNQLKNIDKEHFHKIILENKLAPILIKHINIKGLSDCICKAFYKKCKIQTRRYQIHSLQVINEIREINSLFAKEGLTFLYLKGIAMQKVYEDISLRPMVDIDILFKTEDLLRAYETLHKNNFLNASQDQYLDKNNINDFFKSSHHICVITKNNISIELHHRVTITSDFVNCPISRYFFDDYRSVEYFGDRINIPSIENTIIHSLCHFSINSAFKKLLRTLIDIKCISLNQNINWEKIILKYDDIKIRKGISLSLELMNLNKVHIKNLNRTRSVLEEFFPNKKLIQTAQNMLYDISNNKPRENFLVRLKNPIYLKTLSKALLPTKNVLKFKYETSDINYRLYLKYYIEQFLKIPSAFSIIKKKDSYLRHTYDINNWLNKHK